MDKAFETYARLIPVMQDHFAARHAKAPSDSEGVHRAAIRAKALDTLRGMLPAATQSNVGIYGTGQAYETLLLRMRAHPLAEVRACADEMLDRAAQGHSSVPHARRQCPIAADAGPVTWPIRARRWAAWQNGSRRPARRTTREVTLTEFDPEGEVKIVAAALYAASDLPDDDC